MSRQKLTTFLLLVGVGVLLFILAASLSQVDLKPGQPFSLPSQPPASQPPTLSPVLADTILLVIRGVLALTIVLMPIALISLLLNKRQRKRQILALAQLVAIWLLFIALSRVTLSRTTAPAEIPIPNSGFVGEEGEAAVLETATDPPEWVTGAASLVIAVILAAVSIGAWRLLRRGREPLSGLESLAAEAQDALDQLEMGADVRETVLRCYIEMIKVVEESRGVVRSQHVTPHEFETMLRAKGLPAESLMRLTHLFEQARYGSQPADPQEEQLAILCLRDIVAACQESKPYAA